MGRTVQDTDISSMKFCDFTDKSKPKSSTAYSAASGLATWKKGIKMVFRTNPDSAIGYSQNNLVGDVLDINSYRTARTVVFDRIFHKVIDCPVQKNIVSGQFVLSPV